MLPMLNIELKDAGDDADPAALVTKALDSFQSTYDARLKEIETKSVSSEKLVDRLDKIEAKMNRPANDNGAANDNAPNIERKELADFARSPGNVEMKSLSAGSNPDGGYLSLPTIEAGIRTIARDASPIRSLASVQSISTDSYEIIIDESDVDSGWVTETSERPETEGPRLRHIAIPVHELYAAPRATQKILDDANLDLGAWLEGKIGERFARVEGSAFAVGTGVGMPRGFLTYETDAAQDFTREWGKFQHVVAGATNPSDEQLADALVKLSLTLRTPYRANATWLMSREAAVRIRQIKDSNKHFIWQPGLQDGSPDRLCGFSVAYDDSMAPIGAGALPIALADWKQAYQIVDRHGIRVLRDPFTAKPYTIFYAYRRVGGGAVDFNALKFLKIAAA